MPAGMPQRDCKFGLELRIVTIAHGGLERCDGILGPVLHQQRIAENAKCAGVSRFILKHVASNPLRLERTIGVERRYRLFDIAERAVRAVIHGRPPLRHDADSATATTWLDFAGARRGLAPSDAAAPVAPATGPHRRF